MLNRAARILRGGRSSHHDPNDGSGHEIGHGARKHGANAEPREICFFIGREGADASDLNSNRAEIREAAKREGGNGEGAGIEPVLHWAEALEGDEFVSDHTQTE